MTAFPWRPALSRTFSVLALTLILGLVASGAGWTAPGGPGVPGTPAQKSFGTPQDAVKALVAAVKASDEPALLGILGPKALDVISSGDPVVDRRDRMSFLAAVGQRCDLTMVTRDKAGLVVGTHRWAFPIPLVRRNGAWSFDSRTGADEIVNRRIGNNELAIIDFCHAFVDAQREYAAKNPTGRGRQFAQRVLSTPGTKDGLYWPVAKGQPLSPLGPYAALAEQQGYDTRTRVPVFHGYHMRLLTSQGPHAPGGARGYLVDGRMTGGFALVAWPAEYKVGGVMTFIVNQAGVVFEKDLGPETPRLVQAVNAYDPDPTWRPTVVK